ncbi:Rho GTPase activation protein, partial [Dimargaris cristalligena]
PVFGTEIAVAAEATQLDDGLPLPAVVIRCIEYLDDQGLYEIGLYRIPGSSSRCETDPHSVAGLLKLYLRELPSAPLTDELLPEFNAVV